MHELYCLHLIIDVLMIIKWHFYVLWWCVSSLPPSLHAGRWTKLTPHRIPPSSSTAGTLPYMYMHTHMYVYTCTCTCTCTHKQTYKSRQTVKSPHPCFSMTASQVHVLLYVHACTCTCMCKVYSLGMIMLSASGDDLGHFRVVYSWLHPSCWKLGCDLGLTLRDLGLGMLTDSCFLIMVQWIVCA